MSSKTSHDAIALLKADHRAVEELFDQYEKSRSTAKKAKLAEKICMELTIHTMIEEEILYPACRGKIESDQLEEAYVEHDGAKILIVELLSGEPDDEFFDAKVKVLSEDIKHHVKEEERRNDGLFALAKKADIDLEAVGSKLHARKQELVKTFKRDGLPAPRTRTFSNRSRTGEKVEASV